MEIVKVLKNIPGFIKKGDRLESAAEGKEFVLFEKNNTGERSISIDYNTVCDNIPIFFDWVIEDNDIFEAESFRVIRSEGEIRERVEFFRNQLETFRSGEESTVYNNLLWFVDWLTGKAELLK